MPTALYAAMLPVTARATRRPSSGLRPVIAAIPRPPAPDPTLARTCDFGSGIWNQGELQHFVHAARAIALEVERDILEAKLFDAACDRLGQTFGEEPRHVLRRKLDAGDLAMVADANLSIAELAQQLFRAVDLLQLLAADPLAI